MLPAPVLPHAQNSPSAAATPFTRIPDAVLLDPRLSATQLRIYAVIARRADRETASAFPSYATIAKDAGISRRSAINGVTALVSIGYLTKRSQQSGCGDLTSNRYTVSGAGSEIFAPCGSSRETVVQNLHHYGSEMTPQVVQELHSGGAVSASQVVQDMHHGSANAAPESESLTQRKENKTQENEDARASAHSSAASATDPAIETIFTDFHDNIGALTPMASDALTQLAHAHGAEHVRDAIREAVVYEKRSLGYVRRVLGAWQRGDRAQARGEGRSAVCVSPAAHTNGQHAEDLVWPPPDLNSDLPPTPDRSDPAAVAWEQVRQQLPQLGRLTRHVSPLRLIGDVLTVGVSEARTHRVMTEVQCHMIQLVVRHVLGSNASLHVELRL